MDMFNNNSISSELEKLIYTIKEQVLQDNLSILALTNLLSRKGVFSGDEFRDQLEHVKEGYPYIVDGINNAKDNIKVIDILQSKQKFTAEDKEFLKQYTEKYDWKEGSLDNIIEQHDSMIDLNESWSKIFGNSFDSMLK